MKKAFWLATLAYLLPTFPLGYFWHLSTFRAAYDRLEMYRPEVIIPFGLLSMAIQALIFAWAFPRLFSTRREDWLKSAAGFFAAAAALSWSFTTLAVGAKYRMTSVPAFMKLETAFTLLQFAVVAPLVSLAYRGVRGPKAAGERAIGNVPHAS